MMSFLSNPQKRVSTPILRAQIENSLKLAVTAAAGGLFNAVVAAITLWSSQWQMLISLWLILNVTISGARLAHARHIAKQNYEQLDTRRDERIISLLALCSGINWGTGIAFAAMIATPEQFNLLAMLSGGMMGASVMTFGPLPRAAAAFIGPLAVGTLVAWSVAPVSATWAGILLIVSYVFVIRRTITSNERLFVAKIEGEIQLRESAETVQLLLNDYESQSSDWLWSVNGEGRIIDACPRFAEVSGRARELLNDFQLIDLFDEGPERIDLADRIKGGFGFRDLTLCITVSGAPHWWTLSAQPKAGGGFRGMASDVTAQKRAEARVSYMAHYDGLTGLANRFLFNDVLTWAFDKRTGVGTSAVLCLDLDQFKAVNDTLGHPVGDKLLCEVARRIELCVDDSDLIARLGGDEFAVLVKQPEDMDQVEACAMRIIESLRQPFVLDGMQVMTSASVGITMAQSGAMEASEFLKRADLALYSAKTNGRNRFAHFEVGMDEAARERRELEMDLRAALVHNQFELHYQPLINVETGEVASYEALVRWNHPARGVVMPDVFIPIAEETGLIVQIGEWVIRHAMHEVAKWPEHLRVSINLSPAQMRCPSLISMMISSIAHAGIDASRIEMEITETVLMHDTDVNIALLHKLRDIGVRISLDDFGTGYSSLNYLRSFPFDKIKIDRCFVDHIDEREDCRAIVRAVTSLASSLGMTTTAEGVETQQQMDRLRTEGCTEVQGYLFSKPARSDEFTDLRNAATEIRIVPKIPVNLPLLPASAIEMTNKATAPINSPAVAKKHEANG